MQLTKYPRRSDDEDVNLFEGFKVKLDKMLFEETLRLDNKRLLHIKRQAEIEAMDDNGLKKRLQYANDQRVDKETVSINLEEVEVHEAYQFCIREYEVRHRPVPVRCDSEGNLLTQTPKKHKKNRKQSAEVVSMYRGEKSVYEKVCEADGSEIHRIYEKEPKPDNVLKRVKRRSIIG